MHNNPKRLKQDHQTKYVLRASKRRQFDRAPDRKSNPRLLENASEVFFAKTFPSQTSRK
jgi:hypothetical protein